MRLKVGVVGLGQVALRFDLEEQRRKSGEIWTHFSAYEKLRHKFQIIAGVDPNQEHREYAKSRCEGIQLFSSIEELIGANLDLDLVSICTPEQFHLSQLEALLPHARGFFLEKPVSSLEDTEAASLLLQKAKKLGRPVYVNYYKRLEPLLVTALERIKSGKESIRHLECRYSGPFVAVGSHALDLLNHLKPVEKVLSSVAHPNAEGEGRSLVLKCADGVTSHLVYTGLRHQFVFELDIFTEKSRFLLTDNLSSATFSQFQPSERYKNYQEYQQTEKLEQRENPYRFVQFLEMVHGEICENRPNYANFGAAIKTQILIKETLTVWTPS